MGAANTNGCGTGQASESVSAAGDFGGPPGHSPEVRAVAGPSEVGVETLPTRMAGSRSCVHFACMSHS